MDLIIVYFIYGLSFFSMGLAVLLEVNHSSRLDYARAVYPLGWFGLVHGIHEWLEMFIIIYPDIQHTVIYHYIGPIRIGLLVVSFLFLLAFGARLVFGADDKTAQWRLFLSVSGIWLAGCIWVFATHPADSALISLDVYTRYALAIPGAALTAWGLVIQQRRFAQMGMRGFGRDVIIAAVAFGLYGAIGQLFVSPSSIFPSQFLNASVFLAATGFPIQMFRSAMALIAAVSMISSLRAFESETQRQIEGLREAQQREQKQREELRAELLRRTVRAQEFERQRIARELHDELGQLLTALGLGLRAISNGMSANPERVRAQSRELLRLVDMCFDGLQNLISGLHPPQLDDFGLVSTLRWYAQQVRARYDLKVDLDIQGHEARLPADITVVLFRIVQEGLTNVIRHAQIDHARVQVKFDEGDICIRIEDNGSGFDVDSALQRGDRPCWGLLGMIERARLVGGACRILSKTGVGTAVEVCVPVNKVSNHVEHSTAVGG